MWSIGGIFLLLIYGIWLRSYKYRKKVEVEPVSSPLSLAIQDLIGTAGGIYLAITLLISFIKIVIPDKIIIFAIEVEPIALISILLAVFQPVIERIIRWVRL